MVPFLAADAVLLVTALLIAWRTPDALAGGALLGVVVCVVLGAVLAVLPFVLNDAHAREKALAERQRELSELVTTSTATASRWGTQWAAAALGLEDAASLASRSIASAEQLPAVFQAKAEAFAEKLAQVEHDALARAEKSAEREAALAARLAQAEREAAARLEQGSRQEAALAARIGEIGAASEALQRTLGEFGRVEAGLREQRAAIMTALAEFPAAAAQANAARTALDERLAAAPAQVEAQVSRCVGEAEARLGASVSALTARLAEVEATLGAFLAQLERAAAQPVSPAVPVAPVPAVVPAPEPVAVVTAAAAVEEKKPARSEIIMDPFLIPDDGYASLAEAMDTGRA
ncbi:MAG TPA: hypothetical protein VIM44_03890 [Rariglobus sp.]